MTPQRLDIIESLAQPLTAADLAERQKEREEAYFRHAQYGTFAGCSGPCDQGRKLCPSPQACQFGAGDAEEQMQAASRRDWLWFFGVIAASLASLAALLHWVGA